MRLTSDMCRKYNRTRRISLNFTDDAELNEEKRMNQRLNTSMNNLFYHLYTSVLPGNASCQLIFTPRGGKREEKEWI